MKNWTNNHEIPPEIIDCFRNKMEYVRNDIKKCEEDMEDAKELVSKFLKTLKYKRNIYEASWPRIECNEAKEYISDELKKHGYKVKMGKNDIEHIRLDKDGKTVFVARISDFYDYM